MAGKEARQVTDEQHEAERDEQDEDLRPQSLDEFTGQVPVRTALRIAINAAKFRDEALEHVLFFGPPGTGKTTLSKIIAVEMGGGFKGVTGPTLTKREDLQRLVRGLGEKDVFFIDEIHRMAKPPSELLYPVMEDFMMDFQFGSGSSSTMMQMKLPHFTLVGATTRSGALLRPLRQRFGIIKELSFYDEDELVKIVLRSARIIGVALGKDAAVSVAKRSRGTARIANRLLRRCRDLVQSKYKHSEVDYAAVMDAMELEGIDKNGLTGLDRRVMSTIYRRYNGGPVGLGALANTLQVEVHELTDVVEPYLLHGGWLAMTSRGRTLTREGLEEVAKWL